MPAIEVEGLRKRYGDVEAVRGIDFAVNEGEVFSLLGPNGAGKTTTVEILEGYRRRDEGRVLVLGSDPAKRERRLREQIGIVLQQPGVEDYLTVEETIDMFRAYYPHPRPTAEIIKVVGLEEKRDARVIKLSGGQRRRLDVAVALAGDPKLLFLDEPTTGFDPGARRNAWAVIENLQDLGKTVLLTTHYMDEAQKLADRVAIIVNGVIVADGPPSTLAGREKASTIVRFRAPSTDLPEGLRRNASVRDGVVELRTEEPTRLLHELTGWALEGGLQLDALEVARPTLEDVYLELTKDAAPSEAEPETKDRRGRRSKRS